MYLRQCNKPPNESFHRIAYAPDELRVMHQDDHMTTEHKRQVLKWPESLPPFVEMRILPRENEVFESELLCDDELQALLHDMYFFEDETYYVYREHDKSPDPDFSVERLSQVGIALTSHENYFYRRPFSDQGLEPYSYVRILPGEDRHPWQKEIVRKGPMFTRIKLELHPWKKKQMDLARLSSFVQARDVNPVELKPNFMGFGIDLIKLWSWIRSRFQRKQDA